MSSSYLTKTKPESGSNGGSGNTGSSGSGNTGSGNSGESETTKPTESTKVWSTIPGSRPYEYQEISEFTYLMDDRCGIYEHTDRYGNVWYDRSTSSNGYGKNIYSCGVYQSTLHYYGNGLWANFGAYWSEDGSMSGGSFSSLGGYFIWSDERGSGEVVYPYGPPETLNNYLVNCSYAASLYNTIMANETWSDEQKAESVAAIWPSYGVSEADVMGYINNPTTHPFPGLN